MADVQLSTNVYVRDNNFDTPTLISRAADAIARMTSDIDGFLTSRIDVVFLPPRQIQGGGGWGYTIPNQRVCTINNSLTSSQTKYTVLHEIAHMIDNDLLNHASKVTLAGLMSPSVTTATAGFWTNGTGRSAPSECFANTFPQAYTDLGDVAGSYYTRTIASGSFGTYRSTITGSGVPTSLTIAADATAGDTNVKYSGTPTGLTAGDWLLVGTGGHAETTQISTVGSAGSGGTGITVSPALTYNHSSGATLVETTSPVVIDPGGSNNPTYQIVIGSANWTNFIPAESIHLSESGSDAPATCEFTIEKADSTRTALQPDYPWDVVVTNLATGFRLFGGNLVGYTKRHMDNGVGIAWDCRAISYDAWLDRTSLPSWWTTATGTQSGNKLADDRLIVQRIIKDGNPGQPGQGGGPITADNTYVNSTNTSMPKLNLTDGTLRDMILRVADVAATVADPTPRRVYVDFHRRVHYFKGNESSSAPYIIGDASYGDTIKNTTGLVSYWPMGEGAGAVCQDTKGLKNLNLAGFYVRGITPGVVNEPGKSAIYFRNNGYASVTSASYHPGNTFSIECWFQRNTTGSEQTLFDGGTADYAIEFQADNTIRVYKKGTGNDFTTTATYTDTNWHHLVVTHSGSATHVYVDGNDKAGTAALKSFAPSTNDLYVGRLSDGTLKLNASLQHIAFYSSVLSSTTVNAHYNDGVTLVPDYLDYDRDWNNSVYDVYVRGANAAGTGWVGSASGHAVSQTKYGANTIVDRPESDTLATRQAIQSAYLHRDGADVIGGHFQVIGYDGWRAGQSVTLDDSGLGLSGSYEIKYIETTFSEAGSGMITYDVFYGAMPWRGTFDIRRKSRKNSIGSSQLA